MARNFTDPILTAGTVVKKVYKDELVTNINAIISEVKEAPSGITIENTGGNAGLSKQGIEKIRNALNVLATKFNNNCNCNTNDNCCQAQCSCQLDCRNVAKQCEQCSQCYPPTQCACKEAVECKECSQCVCYICGSCFISVCSTTFCCGLKPYIVNNDNSE